MPQRVDVWMVEMDLTSSEASNRETELLQPTESSPRQPLPGYGDEAVQVCTRLQHCLSLPLPIQSLEVLFILWQVLSSHSSLWPQVTCCNTTSPVQHPEIVRAWRGLRSAHPVSSPTHPFRWQNQTMQCNTASVLIPSLVWVSVLEEKSDL